MVDCLHNKISQLRLVGERLCHLGAHDAITILRYSLAIPKLLHILRTSPAFWGAEGAPILFSVLGFSMASCS